MRARSGAARELEREAARELRLHGRVLQRAERALQALQVPDGARELVLRHETAAALEQVAQLLARDAQLVQLDRRTFLRELAGQRADLLPPAAQTRPEHGREGHPGLRTRALRSALAREDGAQPRAQRLRAFGAEIRAQTRLDPLALGREEQQHGLELRAQLGLRHAQLEEQRVEVARGARAGGEPAQLAREQLLLVVGEHALQLRDERAQPAHGHARVVHELGVLVGEQAGLVGAQDRELRARDAREGLESAHVRREPRPATDLARRSSKAPTRVGGGKINRGYPVKPGIKYCRIPVDPAINGF